MEHSTNSSHFPKKAETLDLDTLTLREERNVLSEVVVEGQRIPIIINKDTVSYQAGAFNVRTDENVEDFLKRLPGIEVDADGQVTAQGQQVTKVFSRWERVFWWQRTNSHPKPAC
ncbi:MAG: hypothetical protein U5L96_07890 [Owenweeksia sp.]|nr:hypothetical protein [Owenweeksia sp.]